MMVRRRWLRSCCCWTIFIKVVVLAPLTRFTKSTTLESPFLHNNFAIVDVHSGLVSCQPLEDCFGGRGEVPLLGNPTQDELKP
jgi:hypothetical protein